MPKNKPRTPEAMRAFHTSDGLSEAFAELYDALPAGSWVSKIEPRTDTYNVVYDENLRWFVEVSGVGGQFGWEESVEADTLPRALVALAKKVREDEYLHRDDPFKPDVFAALSFLAGENSENITFDEASAILSENGPWNPLLDTTAEAFTPVPFEKVVLGNPTGLSKDRRS